METEDSMICEKCKQKAEVGVTGRSAAPYWFLCLGCASEPQPDSTRTFTLSTRMVHGVIEDFRGGSRADARAAREMARRYERTAPGWQAPREGR